MARLVGIDFGAKLAGTTVIAAADSYTSEIKILQSQKNKNADAFLSHYLNQIKPDWVGIDAPLSLPGVYQKMEGCYDFHYRKADLEAKAMSPMFLGGLTARAMSLRHSLNIPFIEVYPKLAAHGLALHESGYKTSKNEIKNCLSLLKQKTSLDLNGVEVENWHQFDALLALDIVLRFTTHSAQSLGLETEGILYF